MRVLVTGGAGFVGSHTVDALLKQGYEVRVLDSLESPVHPSDWPSYLPPEAERMRGSILDANWLSCALADVDAVYHFAAYQDYLTDFSRFFQTNATGTALLYEIIVNERLPIQKIVVASSQAVYGEGRYRCPWHGVTYPGQRPSDLLEQGQWDLLCAACDSPLEPQWTDEDRVSPHNSYAMSKRSQEELAVELGRRYAIPTVALRYSIIQGPRQSIHNAYSGVLRSFAVRALTGRSPILYEDGLQQRDYVSIHDVVRANLLVLVESRADYHVFNVGGARRVRVRDLAEMILEEAGASLEPQVLGHFRVGDTRHIFSDVARLGALGWAPQVSQREMVREYLTWAANEPDLHDTVAPAHARMLTLGVLRTATQAAS